MVNTKNKDLQSYYSRQGAISDFMAFILNPAIGDSILEPSIGHGDLIRKFIGDKYSITGIDKDPQAIIRVREIYSGVNLIHDDFIDMPDIFLSSYDRVISNPPYGAWIEPNRRKILKSLYPSISTKESYAMFVYRSIQLLKQNGRAVFILPDTFLYVSRHKGLREHVFRSCMIEEIYTFPSKLFPDVNFSYGGMCIIVLTKKPVFDYVFKYYYNIKDDGVFNRIINDENPEILHKILKSTDINHSNEFRFDGKVELDKENGNTLGEIADIVTGIYSGDDKRFIRCLSKNQKRGKSFNEVDKHKIHDRRADIEGFETDDAWIPILKGGAAPFHKPTQWYISWTRQDILYYRNSKKSRFQNSQYYFKEGVGIPMVSSGRITGSLLENRLFDQSIVGIFPKDSDLLWIILAFVNTDRFTQTLRKINPSANNSANYVKRVPFILPNADEFIEIERLSKISYYNAVKSQDNSKNLCDIEAIFDEIFTR